LRLTRTEATNIDIPKTEPKRSHKYTNEFTAEVVVEPAVEKGICAGGRHADQMTSGVDNGHLFFISRAGERVVQINEEIECVQWKPRDGENKGDGHQQVVPPPQTL